MRTIRFRAWDKHMKRMRMVRRIDFTVGNLSSVIVQDGNEIGTTLYGDRRDEFILEQSTDLKDRNGKEIFEGDIILPIHRELAQIVVWENAGFCCRSKYGAYHVLTVFPDSYEVIGNIHQNPELLGEGK